MRFNPSIRILMPLLVLVTLCLPAATAYALDAYSVPPDDAPELAKIGNYAVGLRTLTLTNKDQPDIPSMVKTSGAVNNSDRTLKLEVWYPAAAPKPDTPVVVYSAKLPRSQDPAKRKDYSYPGIARRDATPLGGQRFPLVLVSHGFSGWGTFMSYLTENLASKGYVVVAVDHGDATFSDGAGFMLSFGSTLVHRARDQQFALEQIAAMAKTKDDALGAIIDMQSIGVIGYSMGGYGALATAGAGYDPASPSFKQIPPAMIAPLSEGNAQFNESRPKNIKALVLIAPWGNQPSNRAWTTKSLQAIRASTLLVVGDHDDVVDYQQGVKPLFDEMTSSKRYMLVYQNARHNTGGNPPPLEALDNFTAREYFDEPVWRKDRITSINQHFITAFLDLNLKNDATKSTYLDLPTVKSNEAKWSVAFGQNTGATVASGTADTAQYWRGFQRRWAIGLEMHSKSAAQ